MKNIATLFTLLLSMFLVGCAEKSHEFQRGNDKKNVEIQVKYNGKATSWNAFVLVQGDTTKHFKADRDTNALSLGNLPKGSTFHIMYGEGANNDPSFSQIDPFLSINVKIGDKDTTVYGIEGLYTRFTVN